MPVRYNISHLDLKRDPVKNMTSFLAASVSNPEIYCFLNEYLHDLRELQIAGTRLKKITKKDDNFAEMLNKIIEYVTSGPKPDSDQEFILRAESGMTDDLFAKLQRKVSYSPEYRLETYKLVLIWAKGFLHLLEKKDGIKKYDGVIRLKELVNNPMSNEDIEEAMQKSIGTIPV